MACGTPVIASAIGGIPEVISHDETGLVVPFEPVNSRNGDPKDPEKFSKDLANAVNSLLSSPEKIKRMGAKSRERVEKHFSWKSIAQKTFEFYKELTQKICPSLGSLNDFGDVVASP
jgi:glycosyltransferase involved in cell wall biosynthesis